MELGTEYANKNNFNFNGLRKVDSHETMRGNESFKPEYYTGELYVILTVHSIAIGSYLFIMPTDAQFYNIITSPLYVFRHSECHPQGVTVLKA
jgi:hypothetical protein